jgi:peptidoglycan hydrolase CwlO-like protein
MKKTILLLSLSIMMMGLMLTSCQSKATKEDRAKDKVEDAEGNLKNARTNLSEVKQDTLTAYQEFVKKSEAQLKEYDKYIADLKTKIVKEKKKDKALY